MGISTVSGNTPDIKYPIFNLNLHHNTLISAISLLRHYLGIRDSYPVNGYDCFMQLKGFKEY